MLPPKVNNYKKHHVCVEYNCLLQLDKFQAIKKNEIHICKIHTGWNPTKILAQFTIENLNFFTIHLSSKNNDTSQIKKKQVKKSLRLHYI